MYFDAALHTGVREAYFSSIHFILCCGQTLTFAPLQFAAQRMTHRSKLAIGCEAMRSLANQRSASYVSIQTKINEMNQQRVLLPISQ